MHGEESLPDKSPYLRQDYSWGFGCGSGWNSTFVQQCTCPNDQVEARFAFNTKRSFSCQLGTHSIYDYDGISNINLDVQHNKEPIHDHFRFPNSFCFQFKLLAGSLLACRVKSIPLTVRSGFTDRGIRRPQMRDQMRKLCGSTNMQTAER